MRKFLNTLLLGAALVMPISAHAGIVCSIQDTVGNQLTYVFGPNTRNSVVETGFQKNGRMVISEVGNRPVWIYSTDGDGYGLSSQEAPGWVLAVNGYAGQSWLMHNGAVAGSGSCSVEPDHPDTIPDAGMN